MLTFQTLALECLHGNRQGNYILVISFSQEFPAEILVVGSVGHPCPTLEWLAFYLWSHGGFANAVRTNVLTFFYWFSLQNFCR